MKHFYNYLQESGRNSFFKGEPIRDGYPQVSVVTEGNQLPFVNSLLGGGLAQDAGGYAQYGPTSSERPTQSAPVSESGRVLADDERSFSKSKTSRMRLLASAGVLAGLAPVVASCATGPLSSVTVEWGGQKDTVPSNYYEPVLEAGKICPGISADLLFGIATVEDGPTFDWNPTTESPAPARAKGPMQFEDATIKDLVKRGIVQPGDVEDVDYAVRAAAQYLCVLVDQEHGDVDAALEDYNGHGAGYAQEVDAVKNSVEYNYRPVNQSTRKSSNGRSSGSHTGEMFPLNTPVSGSTCTQDVQIYDGVSFMSFGNTWQYSGDSNVQFSGPRGTVNIGDERVTIDANRCILTAQKR